MDKSIDVMKQELAALEGRATPQDGITAEEREKYEKYLVHYRRCPMYGGPSSLESYVQTQRQIKRLYAEFITDAPTPANETVIPEAALVTPPTAQPEPKTEPEPPRIELTPELIDAYYDEKIAELRRQTQK